ncbi:TetR/AcrR family transcriptional regulator [Aeromicrobium wangtongii]|uniref:TetR/AcrR family transcriptional regulator n=1 Tax=Aeromicrobium wangtongii TaxID=2969247 RepID=A0ABY5M322_9ACTN|nr:TetR/AcrR family transcriptional regulator [Aeromicrobium wangtongii]MCD9198211.1 TetR/AcrR family transcriptional regulator [Aeromicrobium wangtongii]MCL3819071.1 TetR/AcrR family transcriptional regulator [Aeromicrobium wangtongii]UUP12247.1 TetR/AcrR family transcriptional regulator [Aeromicrobium wangtongii]
MSTPRLRLAPAERRQQIIDAAGRLYADRPYDAVSTAELADAAGVARGLINHYFGDKRELFLEVMRESIMMPERALPDYDGKSIQERARLTMDWILDAATTYGQAWVAASGAANLHGSSDLQAVVDAADDRAARLVLDALGLPDTPHLRARLRPMAALTKAVCREWLQRATLTRTEALDLLTDSVLLFIRKEPSVTGDES